MMFKTLLTSTAALTMLGAPMIGGQVFGGMAHAADLTLAIAGPFSGQNASYGEQYKIGATQAAAALNAKGGINGKKVVLDFEDDACDPKQAVAVANKVVSKGEAAVIGHFCSSSSIPASDVYSDAGLVMISPASTNPKLTDRGMKTVFRTCGRDDQQASVAANAIVGRKLGTKIAVLDDRGTYGKGLADGVREALKAKNVKVVMDDSVTAGDKDFSTIISKLKAANVDFVYYGGYFAEAGLLVRQAREQGLKATFMGGDGILSSEFPTIAGPAADGFLMTFSPDPTKYKEAAAVVKKIKDAKENPEGYVLFTYAAIQAYAEAATKAKSLDGPKVAAELHKGNYATVIGNIAFNAKGDVNAEPYVVYVWKDGKYTEMK